MPPPQKPQHRPDNQPMRRAHRQHIEPAKAVMHLHRRRDRQRVLHTCNTGQHIQMPVPRRQGQHRVIHRLHKEEVERVTLLNKPAHLAREPANPLHPKPCRDRIPHPKRQPQSGKGSAMIRDHASKGVSGSDNRTDCWSKKSNSSRSATNSICAVWIFIATPKTQKAPPIRQGFSTKSQTT